MYKDLIQKGKRPVKILTIFGFNAFVIALILFRTPYRKYSFAQDLATKGVETQASIWKIRGKMKDNIYPEAEMTYVFTSPRGMQSFTQNKKNVIPPGENQAGNIPDPIVTYLPYDPGRYTIDPVGDLKAAKSKLIDAISLCAGTFLMLVFAFFWERRTPPTPQS